MYRNIQEDYNIYSDLEEDDDYARKIPPFDSIDFPDLSADLIPPAPQHFEFPASSVGTLPGTSTLPPPAEATNLADLFKDRLDKIESKITTKNNEDTKEKLSQCFKCVICFESRPNSYAACFKCGRFLGCFRCIKRLKTCPICRKPFKCPTCTANLPRNPLFIPGMDELVNKPDDDQVSTTFITDEEHESSSDSDLPPVSTAE